MFYFCDVEMKAVTHNLAAYSHKVISYVGDQEVGEKNEGYSSVSCLTLRKNLVSGDLRWATASGVGRP